MRIVTLAALGVFLLTTSAQAKRAPRDQLALEVAVVAAHEGAFKSVKDTALIWQVVEARAATTEGRLKFLRAHSPKALGVKTCASGNCVWSRELLEHPDAPPASLDSAWWNVERAELWLRIRRLASELVYGIELWRPCLSAPYSWGYAGDLESAWKERRLVPLGCNHTVNDGFAFASSDVLHVSVARGSRR